jgi:hypothetical protein
MHVQFDAGGPSRLVRVLIDTVGDGEPGWEFNAGPGTDFRGFRGFNVKPVVNGVWDISITVIDDRGCSASMTSANPVTVVVGGR